MAYPGSIMPPAKDTLPGKKFKIRVELGLGIVPLKTSEYLHIINEVTDSLGAVSMQERERILPINRNFDQNIIDAMVAFSVWKELYMGIFYKTNKIKALRRGDNGGLFEESAFFIGVGGLIGYDIYPVKKHRNLAAGIQLGMGTYHGPQFYSGTGRQFLVQTEAYLRYLFRDRYGLKVNFSHHYISYKEEGTGAVLGEPTFKKVGLNNFYLGAGLSFKLHFRPQNRKEK